MQRACRLAAQRYLLRHFTFPSIGRSSIIWAAPCGEFFRRDVKRHVPQCPFIFPSSNAVDESLLECAPRERKASTLVVSAQPVTRSFLSAWRHRYPDESLKLVRRGTSLGSIDLTAAAEHSIDVISTPGVNSPHVGKFVVDVLGVSELPESERRGARMVVLGAGSVGSCVIRRARALGLSPVVVDPNEESIARVADDGVEVCRSIEEAVDGAQFIAVCAATDPSDPLISNNVVKRLLGEGENARRPIRICSVSRPEGFSLSAIRALPPNVQCRFDYGESVLAPVREKVNEGEGGPRENISWSSLAMSSEHCKEDMDEAVLRVLSPLPRCLTYTSSPSTMRKGSETSSTVELDTSTLGVAGGPSAWLQAVKHLSCSNRTKVIQFDPAGLQQLWTSSGRQLSVREKVTRFQSIASALKNLELRPDGSERWSAAEFVSNMLPLATMARTFVKDRLSDDNHQEMMADVVSSVESYRALNTLLKEKAGEAPVFRETGRLVIAGAAEYGDGVAWEKAKEYRRKLSAIDTERDAEYHQFLKANTGLLFQPGYRSYGLRFGGYVVRNAGDIIQQAMEKCFPGRFSRITSALVGVEAQADGTEGYRVSLSDTSEAHVDALYLSCGATHLLDAPRDLVCDEGGEYGSGLRCPERMQPPIPITGHSGVVKQILTRETCEEVLRGSECNSLEEYLAERPCAFMTDDYELTLEGVHEEDGGAHAIRWRVTGNARIYSHHCPIDPISTLFEPVARFLCGKVEVEGPGFQRCTRLVGPNVRESFRPLGANGVAAFNWGHLGVTLAGMNVPWHR